MALFTYPGYPWQFSWTASTATVKYYLDKVDRIPNSEDQRDSRYCRETNNHVRLASYSVQYTCMCIPHERELCVRNCAKLITNNNTLKCLLAMRR